MERSSTSSDEYDGSTSSKDTPLSFAASAAGERSPHDIRSPRASGGRTESSEGGTLLLRDPGTAATGRSSKRTARGKACERCRRMKIKCDGVTPACGTCRKRALNCVFTVVEKPQKPRRREEYVRALENRLSRIESLVEASGILDERQPQPEPVADGLDGYDVDADVDYSVGMPSVMTDATELSDPIGEPRREKLNSEFWKHCIRKSKRPEWINDIIESVITRGLGPATEPLAASPGYGQRTQLPPMDELISMVADFFNNLNVCMPLYHQDTFMFQLYENLSLGTNQSAAWWASLNTVFALALITRPKGTFTPQELEKRAWYYMKNALAIQAELPALDFDVTSIQALIGMALFFQITSFNSQMPSMILATAIRIAHGIGLHVKCEDPSVSAIEKEQRRRVFWIAYMFDRELSLRTGRPPLQDDDDMSIDLPQDNPPDKAGYFGDAHIFKDKCVFAQIQGKVYKQLYSDQSWKQPRDETLAAISNLNNELEQWRLSVKEDFRPGNPISDLPAPHHGPILVLHFCYWYCVSLIHRRYTICIRVTGEWPESAVPESLATKTTGSPIRVAARHMVQLLKDHPPTAKGTRWYTLYYCAAALVSLFGNLINEPHADSIDADLDRVRVLLRFMSQICEDGGRDAQNLFSLCVKLERIAVDVIEKAQSNEPRHTPPEQQREQREELDRQIMRQLHFHGRYFSPLDV